MGNSGSYLLDTCVFLWAAMNPAALSVKAFRAVTSPDTILYFSVASGWEILGKSAKGKLCLGAGDIGAALRRHLAMLGDLRILPIRMDHIYEAYCLPPIHKDPIDRMLIGQARVEHLTLITPDDDIQKYDVQALWM
ncbi:MAG TPA: type II toxin-antitoxin system VapC family toxin [Candidatus Methylomirabilis sp.]|nr:type II toxin-antitoxin system VapC family toxin [Candidatus Methylomirabilis sp.]